MNIPTTEEMDTILCQQQQKQDEEEKAQWELSELDWAKRIFFPRAGCGMATFDDVKRMEKLIDHFATELRIN